MPQRASVTVSPSSSRISRSTPWVDGCCGPMLTTMRSSTSSRSWVMESQSWPVTVKTLPSAVSAEPAYASCVVIAHLHGVSGSPRRCSPGERSGGGEEGRGVTSAVRPPLVGWRDGAALVLDRDTAERVVLALGMARPVVGHQDPRERGVAVEDDAEHVE